MTPSPFEKEISDILSQYTNDLLDYALKQIKTYGNDAVINAIPLIDPSVTAIALAVERHVIGMDVEGCGKHNAFNIPSPFCNEAECIIATAVNGKLAEQRQAINKKKEK